MISYDIYTDEKKSDNIHIHEFYEFPYVIYIHPLDSFYLQNA